MPNQNRQQYTGDRDEIVGFARNDYYAKEDLGEDVEKRDFLPRENLVLIDDQRCISTI